MITLAKARECCSATSRYYGRCVLNRNHGGAQHQSELGTWCECCSPKGSSL